jgi:hypothetical protein
MKFTIRDVLWLTVVVALAVVVILNHWRNAELAAKLREAKDKNEKQEILLQLLVPPGKVTSVNSSDEWLKGFIWVKGPESAGPLNRP